MKPMLVNPDFGLLLVRLMIGFVGVHHGAQKLFGLFGGKGLADFAAVLEKMNVPMPKVSAILAGSAECFGGLLIAMGLFPRLAAIPFAFTMLVAFFHAHGGKVSGEGNGEYALVLAVFAIALFFTGPGRWTVARFLQGKHSSPKTS